MTQDTLKKRGINLDVVGVDPLVWASIIWHKEKLTNIMMTFLFEHRKAKLPMLIPRN